MNRIDEFLGKDKSGYPERMLISVFLILQIIPISIAVRAFSDFLHPSIVLAIFTLSLVITFSEAFRLNSYATIAAPLGAGGIVLIYFFHTHLMILVAGIVMLVIGLLCGIQHLRWRDRKEGKS